jgi:hypothetical protein
MLEDRVADCVEDALLGGGRASVRSGGGSRSATVVAPQSLVESGIVDKNRRLASFVADSTGRSWLNSVFEYIKST